MPGYDRTRIVGVGRKQLDDFSCQICDAILREPVVTDCCQQTYCSDCINEWIATNKKCHNKECSKSLTSGQLRPVPRSFNNVIQDLPIRCTYEAEGCPDKITIGQLDSHHEVCDFRPNTYCNTCSLYRELPSTHNCIDSLLEQNLSLKTELAQSKDDKSATIKAISLEVKEDRQRLTNFKTVLEGKLQELQVLTKTLSIDIVDSFETVLSDNSQHVGSIEQMADSPITNQRKILFEKARIALDSYVVVKRLSADDQLFNFVVDNCKKLLTEKSTFAEISSCLHEQLKKHQEYSKSDWSVLVGYQFGWFIKMVSYVCLRFADIFIVVSKNPWNSMTAPLRLTLQESAH